MKSFLSFSEASFIAIHALGILADKKMRTGQISELLNAKENHVIKVLQKLKKVDFVDSERGPNGGYFIIKNIHEISLFEIIKIIDGDIFSALCPFGKTKCIYDSCRFGDLFGDISKQLVEYLKNESIKDFISDRTLIKGE